MRYRIAKLCDLKSLVNLHYNVRSTYNVGFFSLMGKSFLRQYYKIILNDKNEIIICAEDKDENIQGFISATLDIEAQWKNFRKHIFSLSFGALSSFLMNPKLIKEIYIRYKAVTGKKTAQKFISTNGVRGEYWAWNAKNPDPAGAVDLQRTLMEVLKSLGVKKMYSEVDAVNVKVVKFHKLNKAYEVDRIVLPDGRERILLCNDVSK